jgi:hypothetical protein
LHHDIFKEYVAYLRVTDSKRKATDILSNYPRITTLSFENPASDRILSTFLKAPYESPSKKQKTTTPIKTLKLNDNTIRWIRPAAAFPHLQYLELLDCGLTKKMLDNILKVCGKQLQELTVLGTGNPSDDAYYDMQPIADCCTQLRALTIESDKLSEWTLNKILFNNKNLEKLDLSSCRRVLGDAIAEHKTGLSELILNDTMIGDETLIQLLKQHGPTLKLLDLSDCNFLTLAVVPAITRHCTQLTTLDVTNYDADSDDSLSFLTDEMMDEIASKNPSIRICSNEKDDLIQT